MVFFFGFKNNKIQKMFFFQTTMLKKVEGFSTINKAGRTFVTKTAAESKKLAEEDDVEDTDDEEEEEEESPKPRKKKR